VVLVGQGSVDETAAFKERFEVPFPMIADPERELFQVFGLKQGSTGSLLSRRMFLRGVKAMAKGHGIGVPQGDVRQLPGVFIIDSAGCIRFSYHAASPADQPRPETLLAVLEDKGAA
jgi:alkyl hydroperoxide reductase subunit AhpC